MVVFNPERAAITADDPGRIALQPDHAPACALHLRDLIAADVATRADRTLPAMLRLAASKRLAQFREVALDRLAPRTAA